MKDLPPRSRLGVAVRRLIALLLVAGAGVAVIWGYMEGSLERAIEAEREAPVKAPLRVSTIAGEPSITLDLATRQNSGIQTAPLRSAVSKEQVRAYGMVLDLQSLASISNNYTNTKDQLLTAQAKLNASRMAFERAQRLYQDRQNISAAQLEVAEAAYRVDQTNITAAETQLQNLAASALQEWEAVLGRALIDRTPMFLRLLQRQDVLLQVTVPPGESLAAPPGTAVAQSGTETRTNIEYVSPAPRTDPRIQGISYLYTAPANKGLFPGMNAVILLPSGKMAAGSLVPASAIVWLQGKAWAYFRTGEQSFARREIATGTQDPDGQYLVKGVPSSAEVVVQGAQLLLSEEFRSQIQVGEEGGQ